MGRLKLRTQRLLKTLKINNKLADHWSASFGVNMLKTKK